MTYRVIARHNASNKQMVWFFDSYEEASKVASKKSFVRNRDYSGKVYSNVVIRDSNDIKCSY